MNIAQWDVSVERNSDGSSTASLHEDGKIDTTVEVTEAQLPWLNALRRLIRLSKEAVKT